MMRSSILLPMIGAMPALAGCVPMMAASAVSMAARSGQGTPVSNRALHLQARDACTAQAAHYGTVSVIDVEQHRVNEIIVWGTAGEEKQKRSFECHYSTRITAFKLREIRPQQ